jgi:glycogen(starch) synthase
MRIIIFSWEYPPRVVGHLAEYVSNLAVQLARNNVETYVVTYHDYLTGQSDEAGGVKTVRVTNPVRTHIGVLTWVLTLNQEVERAAANIYYHANGQVDLVDVHDWHFIPAAVTLKKAFSLPFVYSVESFEDHRSPSVNSPFKMAIKSVEWLGLYEAKIVSTKSNWMRDEASRIYKVPLEKVKVVLPDTANWIKNVLGLYGNIIKRAISNDP